MPKYLIIHMFYNPKNSIQLKVVIKSLPTLVQLFDNMFYYQKHSIFKKEQNCKEVYFNLTITLVNLLVFTFTLQIIVILACL